MFTINDDLSIYATRGDTVFFTVTADENGVPYTFQAGDVLRMKIYEKKNAASVVLEKSFPVTAATQEFSILLTEEDTKIGDVISKHKDYWYEIELNPFTNPQTIIGYDEDGAKVFRLFPEGKDSEIPEVKPEDIPFVDAELDMTSNRPVQNQAVARAVVNLEAAYKTSQTAIAEKTGSTDKLVAGLGAELAVERARIDNLVTNEDNPAGDTEVQDMRVDFKGNVHASAGTSVRAGFAVQDEIVKSVLDTVYLPVEYEELDNMGFATNGDGEAILMENENAVLKYGVIKKTGYYNFAAPILIAKNELNDTEYQPYVSYDVEDRENVFIEAGSYFYAFSSGLVPQLRVSYIPENILVAISPNDEYSITANDEIAHTEIEGLLEENMLRINTGRYGLYCYPVQNGVMYRLQSAFFDYPAALYQLFGFAMATRFEKHCAYIKGGVSSNEGAIDIVLKAPIDGYLLVSNDTNTPGNFTLKKVTAISKVSNVARIENQPYKKLLTIGDSLSGNKNLWQPTAIELLKIPEYGILGGAGLTVSDQGADVNTIYNRVMAMELDSSVDLITFWGGYNDFSAARVLSSLKEQLDPETRDATTFYGGVLDCVEKILSTYPLKQVVMIGTTPFYVNGSWQFKTNKHGLKIVDYVNAFREVAEYYSIPFLDLLHTSGFNDYNYSTYYLDQTYWLHPNTEGHKLVGKKVAGFVKGLNGMY